MVTHVIRQNEIILVFSSPLIQDHEINDHLIEHDDVKDIAFHVENC